MKFWRWLTSPEPHPGLSIQRFKKLFVRVLLFALLAAVLSALLSLTPLKPFLNTWWGSLLFVLVLYIPAARYLLPDTFGPRPLPAPIKSKASRRQRQRYAGVRKSAPKFQQRR